MTLAGGNPATLTLRQFLDAGYALLIEEYTRVGVSLLEAVDQTANMRAGGPSVQSEDGASVPANVPSDKDNQRAMRELEAMMGNTTFRAV